MSMATRPLAPIQVEVYLSQMKAPSSPHYNIGGYIRLARIDPSRLQAAHAQLIRSHDVFGSRICADQLAQTVSPVRTEALPILDISREPDATWLAQQLVDAMFEQPLPFVEGELFRAKLLRVGEDAYWYVGLAHHICLDGWGFANWANQLAEYYVAAESPPAASRELQLRDREADAGKIEAERAYWSEQLQNTPERFLAGQPTSRSAQWSARLPVECHGRMHAYAARHGISPANVYAAVFVSYIAEVYGQADLLLATPTHNRTNHAAKRALGAFADITVLRLAVRSGMSFHELVLELASAQKRSLRYQRLPLGYHLRQLGGTVAAGPDYQVGFNYLPLNAEMPFGAGIGELVYCSHHHEQLPLMLTLCEYGKSLAPVIQINYNLGYFEAAEAALMGERITVLMTQLLAQPLVAIDRHDLLAPAERKQLERYRTPTSAFADAVVHRLFEAQAARQPEAVAVVFEDHQLSYGELNRRANRLAHYLIAHGVAPDARVALCVERSLDMVVGLLAVLKAGGAYVPLDPAYPQDRLAYMLNDSAPMLLLTHKAWALPATARVPVFALDTPANVELLATQPDTDPAPQGLTPASLAYVIYTSGSTGQAKGVMVEHRQVSRLLHSTEQHFGFGRADVWSLFHSIAFDFSVWEIWGAIAYGGKLIVVPAACARSPQRFYELLCDHGVTILNQTPSAFKQLMAAQQESPRRHVLRSIIFGGEALDMRSLLPWLERNSLETTELINMYGITEITVHATYLKLHANHIAQGRSVIGAPLADLGLHILDPYGRLAPIGVVGEIHIGGAGVVRGYLNRPELTAERFLPDPFSSAPDARLYRTGDLGRWLADGNIEYLGRNDFQVKIRGFRIELGEIEARLAACDGVREALVLAREDQPGDKRLVAYLLATDGAAPSAAGLRAALAARLPDYMVPAAFVTLDAFPLTPNGKLDREALPVPLQDAMAVLEYEAPHDEVEQAIARIWQEQLGVPRIGRHDSFFALGGHSLTLVKISFQIQELYGFKLSISHLYGLSSLKEWAAHIKQMLAPQAGKVGTSKVVSFDF